jgi:alanine racemase
MQIDSPATCAVVVDLDALARNYTLLRRTVAPSECGAVVKANAYGLGVARVAHRLHGEGCRHFFVATEAEGIELRAALGRGSDVRLYAFEGAARDDIGPLVEAEVVPVLNTLEQIARWRPTGRPAAIHIDTGMNRLGLARADVERLAAEPERLEGLVVERVMTHLACADESDHRLNADQPRLFDELRALLPEAGTSIANSAGAFLGPAQRGDLVRPGIALYGGNPFVDRRSPVEPVASLRARVLQLRHIDDVATVGYGATFAAARGSRTAVLGIGYADGYSRMLGNCGVASVAGRRVPVIGRVSMDLTAIDVSSVPEDEIAVGTWVELFGNDIAIDDVAEAAGTIAYELLTSLGSRVERIYVGE